MRKNRKNNSRTWGNRICIAAFLLTCSLMLGGCGVKKEKEADSELPKIVIGMDYFEPYSYQASDGEYKGIDVELAKEAFRRLGYRPKFENIVWEDKDELLADGTVDCLWSSYSMNGREDKYQWAGPYLYSRQMVVVKNESEIQTLSDLKGKRIAVQATTKAEDLFLHNIKSDLPQMQQVNCFSTTNEIYAALRKSYVDAIAGHEAMLGSLVKEGKDCRKENKMSRQMRSQMPQVQKKKFDRNACLLVFTLIFVGILIFSLLTASDNKKLNRTLNETFDFVKTRIESYEIYNTNDQVKSLVRLMDKTTELSRVIAQEGNFRAEMLDKYAKEQRLTGILVLDKKLKVIEQTTRDGDAMPLWQKLIESDYVRDIVEHPEKTYTTRLRNEGKLYDFVAVARQDASGILIAYEQKEEVNEINGDLTMASLFSNFPFEMNGCVAICDEDKIVSTNKQNLVSSSVEGAKSLYENEFKSGGNGIVHLRSKNGNWYGRQEKIKDYNAYVFFPKHQVYITRNTICVIYALLALLIFLFYRVLRNRTEKRSILQDQKRLRVINALGHAYSSISLVNLKTEEIEIVKSSKDMKPDQQGDILSKAHLEELIQQVIAEPFQEAYWEFVDMSTVAKRLEEHETLSFTAQTVDERWLTIIIVPQGYDKDGKLNTVLVANRDMTEEKEHEIEQDKNLRNALAAAEHANRAKTAFLNNMSHDIRTPMNAIIGFTALATTHIGSTELVLDYLKKIQTSSQHLLSLINDVLDMSRIESGSVRIEYTTVHLPDILHDLRTIIQGSVYSKQQDLYIDTQDVFHEDIIIDKLRLTQVLLNIISNAVKFTPVGGMINIRVSEKPCRREGYTTVIFSVKDNGIGMSPEFCKQVFDSFSREHTVTENGIGGTGLGMAITKNIVDMMGGTIQVESEVGKGTEFTVILECETSGVTVKREPIPELKGARALVVDDDAETCMSVSKMLREIEMTADWTTSGKEAVLRAREAYEQNQEFKVYIIDWLMPDMNGIETVRRIRMVVGPESPIIILTAYDWSDVEQEAREAGVTAFVSKPLFLSELREVLMSPEQRKLIQNENQKIQAASQTSYAGKKVLLVEDNELNREIATAIMEEIGLDVDVAEDGTDAVNIMSSERGNNYDLIFMDIQMPKMDGYTATREIRTLNNSKCANIPIIAMTANAFEEDRKKAIKAGMNGHIAKPISSDVILENLDQIFGR